MQVTAFLADGAESVNGKLYVLGGGWDTIRVSSLPIAHPALAVAVLVNVEWGETDVEHTLTLHLEDEDGRHQPLVRDHRGPDGVGHITSIANTFTARRSTTQETGSTQSLPTTFTVNNLRIDHAGRYRWVLAVDGEVLQQLPFRVIRL